MKQSQIDTPLGAVRLYSRQGRLHSIEFGPADTGSADTSPADTGPADTGPVSDEKCPLLEDLGRQLSEYMRGRRTAFDIDWQNQAWPAATPWQRKARQAMLEIPYGQTISYAQLGRKCGGSAHARAAGLACRTNALPLLVPCHRIVASDGGLGGFTGGVDKKQLLLSIESQC